MATVAVVRPAWCRECVFCMCVCLQVSVCECVSVRVSARLSICAKVWHNMQSKSHRRSSAAGEGVQNSLGYKKKTLRRSLKQERRILFSLSSETLNTLHLVYSCFHRVCLSSWICLPIFSSIDNKGSLPTFVFQPTSSKTMSWEHKRPK